MTVYAAPETERADDSPRGPQTGGVVVVRRNDDQLRSGQGIWRGMRRVIAHFGKSFTTTVDSKDDTLGMFNVQYPEERLLPPQASRNFPILLYDDATGQELCTSCFQCERVCPPQVIHIKQAKDPNTGKPVPAAEEFIIEYDTCMSCGFCAEVCPFEAIKMDHAYELSTPDHLSMDVDKVGLNRPVSYYETIAPAFWSAVRDNALKKLQNNVKRRSGNIGVAPQMIGRVRTGGAAVAAGSATAGAAPARPAAPRAVTGKNMSPEKLARLEAIRAAKRAGGEAAGEQAAQQALGIMPGDPGAVEAVEEAPPVSAPAASSYAGPRAATGTSMPPEKLERLEAIRAANRARRGEE
jgi:formate hydrogenlyase subunit 6/NADH:ubiquinone oxidoreductase subunit I